jgi:ribosomal protein S15P/S13E
MPRSSESSTGSNDLSSLMTDIEFLTARIKALQDHPAAHQSLREAKQELSRKERLLTAFREEGSLTSE